MVGMFSCLQWVPVPKDPAIYRALPPEWRPITAVADSGGKKLSILGGYAHFRQATCSVVESLSSIAKPKDADEPGSTSFFLRVEWYARPVPAGMRRPTITFSFSPRRSSFLPMIAASVSTLVVSWKEAAEMNESVDNDALVMPSSMYSYTPGFLPSAMT